MMCRPIRLSLPLVLFALVTVAATAQEPDSKKLRVFILAGQSNMVGHANLITLVVNLLEGDKVLIEQPPHIRRLGIAWAVERPGLDEHSDIYSILNLPEDWKPGEKFPLIVEYPGNIFFTTGCYVPG